MMSVVDTMMKRSQLGGRRSPLVDEITALYFDQNNNAKMGPKKHQPCLTSCVPCMQASSSEDELKENYNTNKMSNTISSNKNASHMKWSEKKIMKKFNHKHNKDMSVYNEYVGGELTIINADDSSLQQDSEIQIRIRTDLTPQDYDRICDYCNGIKKSQIQAFEAAKQLEVLQATGKLTIHLEDGVDGEDAKKKWIKFCSEGLKHLHIRMKTFVTNTCSCCKRTE